MLMLSLSSVAVLFLLVVQQSHAADSFQQGDSVQLKANALTSIHTQLPREYYSLAVCQQTQGITMDSQSLGEFLQGDRVQSTPYQISMLKDSYCVKLCQRTLSNHEAETMSYFIKNGYHDNWLLDDLPSAGMGRGHYNQLVKRYAGGFPLGFVDTASKRPYVYNHVNIHVDYHTHTNGEYSIVGFAVEPLSVRHRFAEGNFDWDGISLDGLAKQLATCATETLIRREDIAQNQVVASGAKILYTYSVVWHESEVPYTSRWDIYLSEDHLVPAQVHWYSITNSALIALLLGVVIAVVILRNVRNDLGDPDCTDESRRAQEMEEKGWKLVHVEAIRPPQFAPHLLVACCGTGAQLISTVLAVVFFAMLGLLSPANRGQLPFSILIAFVLSGFVNGYVTTRLNRTFAREEWWSALRLSMWGFPSITFAFFLAKQVLFWVASSTGAVPLTTLFVLAALLPVSAGLTYLGGLVGCNQEPILLPERPKTVIVGNILNRHKLSRMSKLSWLCVVVVLLLFNVVTIALALLWLLRRCLVKRSCWSPCCSGVFMLLIGGAFTFGCIYVELFFLMTNVWMGQYYSVFGFLFFIVCILTLTCAGVSIVFNYSLLYTDEYHSWWWQFFSAGTISIWFFFWTIMFFKRLEATSLLTPVLYFGFVAWATLALLLTTGFIGVLASLWFVRTIFSVAESAESTRPLVSGQDQTKMEYVKMEDDQEIQVV